MPRLSDLLELENLGKIQTMKDNPPFKTERQQIQQELSEADEDSVADADMKKAKQMKKYLEKTLTDVERGFKDIEYNLSDFNSPGLKAAYMDAIKQGIAFAHKNKFDGKRAVKKLSEYYKR
tara:strand:- start:424 stop:786 length:363 start_codon:yes stop_codon:yes gene_type:complete